MNNAVKEIMQRTEQALGFQNSTAIVLTMHGVNDWEVYFPDIDYSARGTKQDILGEIKDLMDENDKGGN